MYAAQKARALALSFVLAVLLHAQASGACVCGEPHQPVPARGTSAPKNARIWLPVKLAENLFNAHLAMQRPRVPVDQFVRGSELKTEQLAQVLELLGPASEPAAFGLRKIRLGEAGLYFVVMPKQAMVPGPHVLKLRASVTPRLIEDFGPLDVPFSVTDSLVEKPPNVPTVQVGKWFFDDDPGVCGPTAAVSLRVEHSGWLTPYEIFPPSEAANPKAHALSYRWRGIRVPVIESL